MNNGPFKGRGGQRSQEVKEKWENAYNQVLSNIKNQQMSLVDACKAIGLTWSQFKDNLNVKQKNFLKETEEETRRKSFADQD